MNSSDVWKYTAIKGRKKIKVFVHLDLKEIPAKEVVASELIRYITAFENIMNTCNYKKRRK